MISYNQILFLSVKYLTKLENIEHRISNNKNI